MTKDMEGKPTQERRTGKDRRSGRLNELFAHAVAIGFFKDTRKAQRRKAELS